MGSKRSLVFLTAVAAAVLATPAQATILVSIEPANQVVDIIDGTATVDIVAVIPQADAVVSWGLDLDLLAGTSVSFQSAMVNAPTWTAVASVDLDGLAGLAPTPPGAPIWSDPASILLATVTLSLDSLGVTSLGLSDNNPADLSEGFALDPPPVGAFANVNYVGATIEVVPEPTAMSLLLFAGSMVMIRRNRR